MQEQPGDVFVTEANIVGFGLAWSMNDHTGGDAYYDALTLYFDFTNTHWILGGEEGISLWLFLGLNSTWPDKPDDGLDQRRVGGT